MGWVILSNGVVVIWIASLALYGYAYQTGLKWLLLLSLLHVSLEFPLNWHSFFGIGRELRQRTEVMAFFSVLLWRRLRSIV